MLLQGRDVESRAPLLGDGSGEDGAPARFAVATDLDGDGRSRSRVRRSRRVDELGVNGKLVVDSVEAAQTGDGVVSRILRQKIKARRLVREESIGWRCKQAAIV